MEESIAGRIFVSKEDLEMIDLGDFDIMLLSEYNKAINEFNEKNKDHEK